VYHKEIRITVSSRCPDTFDQIVYITCHEIRRVQFTLKKFRSSANGIMKCHEMQFSPTSCYSFFVRSKRGPMKNNYVCLISSSHCDDYEEVYMIAILTLPLHFPVMLSIAFICPSDRHFFPLLSYFSFTFYTFPSSRHPFLYDFCTFLSFNPFSHIPLLSYSTVTFNLGKYRSLFKIIVVHRNSVTAPQTSVT
jgi:hypothetical protein